MIGEVIAAVTKAMKDLPHRAIAGQRDRAGEAAQRIAAAAYGTNRPEPEQAVVALQAGASELDEAIAHLAGAREALTRYLGVLSGRPLDTAMPATPQRPSSAWDATPLLARFREDMPRLGHVSSGRRVHILDGDGDGRGGGHRWDSEIPGKTKFPQSWSDDKIIAMAEDVARHPDSPPQLQDDNGRWQCRGMRDGVEIVVVLDPDGSMRTARPESGPGVTRNPRW